MIKKILSAVAFLSIALVGTVQAQAPSYETAAGPAKGNVLLSLNLGAGSFIGQSAPLPNLKSYDLQAPTQNWFDTKPILNVEGRWFMTEQWSIKLSGGLAYNYNPGYLEVPGNVDGEGTTDVGNLPTYHAVPNSSNIQFSLGVGADHYWKMADVERLFFRAGAEVGWAYGRASTTADSPDYAGRAIGEAYAFRVAPLAGFDYFIAKCLFVGIEVRPVAYQYSVFKIRPQAGIKLMSSDSHSFSFLSQPMIKFGIRF